MDRTLMPLPYAKDALEPYVTGLTVELHYERHHRGHLNRLLELVRGKPEANESLGALVRTASGELFENAAQVWNHDFFWRSLKPGGSRPGGALRAAIERDFGSASELERRLVQVGEAQFGGGWLWLALDFRNRLRVVSTEHADNPLLHGGAALLGIDLWEHAYYLDYFHERRHYLENVVRNLLDWEFAAENLALAEPSYVEDPSVYQPQHRDLERCVYEVPIRSVL